MSRWLEQQKKQVCLFSQPCRLPICAKFPVFSSINVTTMSSSSNARVPVSSRPERRSGNENHQPRAPTAMSGSRGERQDAREIKSPQPSTSRTSHSRVVSGTQRPKREREVDERRTERVKVTTRETVATRTRSPDRERRAAAPPAAKRPRSAEPVKSSATDSRPRSAAQAESPQRKNFQRRHEC